jgi:hypothetical protein
MDADSYRPALEAFCKRLLARLARLVLWEPVESLRSFVEILSPCLVGKLEKELLGAIRKNRLGDLEKRAFRWVEESFWGDIRQHPDDSLDKRTLRLKKFFDATTAIPSRRGAGEHFPISVLIEYTSLLNLLKPIFKRRPPEIWHLPKGGADAKQFVAATRAGHHYPGLWRNRQRALDMLQEKRLKRWKKKRLELARRVISVEFWLRGEGAGFTEDAVTDPEMTAQAAALRILGAKMDLGNDAVLKLLKEGKQILPPKLLEKLEKAYDTIDTNEGWQFLNRIYPLT